MGGAARNEKRRKQDEAARKLAAAGIRVERKTGPNRTAIILVAVVVVFALLVGGFIFWQRSSGSSGDVAATYPVAVSGAVVTAGTGPVVVDTYEDFLCPQCERFESRYAGEMKTALNEGKITVRYHAIAILDRLTEPQGYSTRAANAALCAASANIYPGYHEKLFAEQPAEGGSGLTDEQLIAFGTELGAGADFAACVTGGTNSAAVTAETDKAVADPALQTDGNFGTPTVTVNGQKIDLNDTSWLQTAIGA
ncbi:DsbA family protein [Pseudonocardia lacus]|uniref:DsbA family protein n=1 Tax=Pseudonocardia lacus TaxID=2835865 RepID=UPI001BDC0095|nr:thioredoxin domain-containing protein [Pseudonocardia lacus]